MSARLWLEEDPAPDAPAASITVTLGAFTETFVLDGDELSRATQRDGSVHAYLSNASREHISDLVENALLRAIQASA